MTDEKRFIKLFILHLKRLRNNKTEKNKYHILGYLDCAMSFGLVSMRNAYVLKKVYNKLINE